MKGKKVVRNEVGEKGEQREYFFGYKTHLSPDKSGRDSSRKAGPQVLPMMVISSLPWWRKTPMYRGGRGRGVCQRPMAGDRGYDDGMKSAYG